MWYVYQLSQKGNYCESWVATRPAGMSILTRLQLYPQTALTLPSRTVSVEGPLFPGMQSSPPLTALTREWFISARLIYLILSMRLGSRFFENDYIVFLRRYRISHVILGTNRALDASSSGYTVIRAERKILHPQFNIAILDNDIALLILETDAPLGCKKRQKLRLLNCF